MAGSKCLWLRRPPRCECERVREALKEQQHTELMKPLNSVHTWIHLAAAAGNCFFIRHSYRNCLALNFELRTVAKIFYFIFCCSLSIKYYGFYLICSNFQCHKLALNTSLHLWIRCMCFIYVFIWLKDKNWNVFMVCFHVRLHVTTVPKSKTTFCSGMR